MAREKITRRPNTLHRYAEVLGVDPAWLLGIAQTLPVYSPMDAVTYHCPIMRSETIEGYGTLYVVYLDALGDWIPVIQSNGIQFTLSDWQQGIKPREAAEIGEYRWVDARGVDAIMLDGLPRVLA